MVSMDPTKAIISEIVGALQAQNSTLQVEATPSAVLTSAPHYPKLPLPDKLNGDCDKFYGFLNHLGLLFVLCH